MKTKKTSAVDGGRESERVALEGVGDNGNGDETNGDDEDEDQFGDLPLPRPDPKQDPPRGFDSAPGVSPHLFILPFRSAAVRHATARSLAPQFDISPESPFASTSSFQPP